MKILILGGDGMLGHMATKYFKKQGYEVLSTTRSERSLDRPSLNLSSFDFNLKKWMKESLPSDWFPELIINCIGIIKPYSEKNMQETIYINSMFPHILSKETNEIGSKLFHITTDCVYSGLLGQYNETDKFDPFDVYGKTKSLGEPSDCFVLRTSIIGPETKGKLSLLEWFFKQENKEINGFQNHFWNGITTLECCEVIEQIIKNNLYENGTKHIFSNIVSKYDMVDTFKDIYNINVKINKVDSKDFCNRTLSTVNTDFFKKLNIKDFKNMIFEMRDFYEKN